MRAVAILIFLVMVAAPEGASAGALSGITALSAGNATACALVTGGIVKCWGYNAMGGVSGSGSSGVSQPTDVPGLAAGNNAVSVGTSHTCVVTAAGGVKCWGDNSFGELGNGSGGLVPPSPPVDVTGLTSGVIDVSAGGNHTCALLASGGVKCWGWNYFGELGDGSTTNRWTPVDVVGLSSGVVKVGAGAGFSCALMATGAVKCWGQSPQNGPTGGSTTPGDLTAFGTNVTALSVGSAMSCVLLTGGAVQCWGLTYPGAIVGPGAGNLTSGVTSIAVGGAHACAITAGGTVQCWGYNANSQLGDGTTQNPPAPVDVMGLPAGIASVIGGGYFTCALTTGGQAYCWGDNSDSEMGNGSGGTVNDLQPTPLKVGTFTAQSVTFNSMPVRDVGQGPFAPSATAGSGLPVSFTGSTPGACTVSGSTVTPTAMGMCTVLASQNGDDTYGPARVVSQSFLVTDTVNAPGPRLGTLATRAYVQSGADPMIAGFIVGGSTPKMLLLRARGPSLAAAGVADPLCDPLLRLYDGGGNVLALNSSWQADAVVARTIATAGFAPADIAESAMLMTLQPGAYTAIVSPDACQGAGVGIVDVFEIDHPESPLVNISTRAHVLTQDNVMIAGFIINGNSPQTVVVSATGPSLAAFGITSPLADPTLTLVRSSDQSIVATNDNWGDAPNAAGIQARNLQPADSHEAAIMVTLPPGAYTAIVSGAGGGTGVSVVGVFATN